MTGEMQTGNKSPLGQSTWSDRTGMSRPRHGVGTQWQGSSLGEQVSPATGRQRPLAPQRPKCKCDCKVCPLLSLHYQTQDRPSKGTAENNESTGRTPQLLPVEDYAGPTPHVQAPIHRLWLWQKVVFTVGKGEGFLHPWLSFLPVPVRVRPFFHTDPRFQQQSLVDTI